jgi:hypothetical protein
MKNINFTIPKDPYLLKNFGDSGLFIFPKEHNPPHFHIISGSENIATVKINDRSLIGESDNDNISYIQNITKKDLFTKNSTSRSDKIFPEVTEKILNFITSVDAWNNRNIEDVKPMDGLKLYIQWKGGRKDVLDVEPAFARDPDLKFLREESFFKQVRLVMGGLLLQFPLKGFEVPADRIWIDCRLQDMFADE